MTQIVVVTSGKGGVGKTTTSASFSSGLALAADVQGQPAQVRLVGETLAIEALKL